jgi:hypothetical protein
MAKSTSAKCNGLGVEFIVGFNAFFCSTGISSFSIGMSVIELLMMWIDLPIEIKYY